LTSRARLLLILLLVTAITGCGGDDPTGPTPPPSGNMEDSINDYWPTSRELQDSFSDLDASWDQLEGAFSAKVPDNAQISTLVNDYVQKTVVVGAKMDALIALEDDIHAYGSAGKGMFTDAAGSVAKGLFTVVKKTVVSSGQMVRTSWRVLSGSHSLREALSASDSGIPIVSDFAKRLEEHNAARDERIIDAINRGDSQEGYVPIGELEGSTTQQKIDYYRNLPDDHPLKKRTRGDVHLWDDDEKTETVHTLKKAAKDQVKNYVGAVSGSDELVEIGDQMISGDQPEDDKGQVRSIVKDADSLTNLTSRKTILIKKKDQPEDEPKVAIVDGVDPDTQIPLATGVYEVVVIAEGYVRSVQENLEIVKNQATTMLHEMYNFAANSLILEGVAASPETSPIDQPVTVTATAASVVGSTLSFGWTITGGEFTGKSQSGASLVFTPKEIGTYTVDLEVTDTLGNSRQGSASVRTTGAEVEIASWSITSEQFNDGEVNPGETVGVSITLANHGDVAVSGTASLHGQDRITAQLTGGSGVNIPAGGTVNLSGNFILPVNYSPEEGAVTLEFSTAGVTLAQDMIFGVVFGVEIDPISSPVTDRVLNISGSVANPSLTTAQLAIGGDVDQVFTMNLSNGRFSQDIAVEASAQSQSVSVLVVADSGSRHAEDTTSFRAQVPPAALRVTLTWDTGGTDVDLWVTDPAGESCGWSHSSTSSGLNLDFDDTDGYGPENITTTSASVGTYAVRVHYYSDHDSENPTPTGCTVVVRLNEGTPQQTVTTYHGSLSDSGDEWSAATITITAAGKAELVAGPGELTRIDPSTLPKKK